jgi:hypothetical protein
VLATAVDAVLAGQLASHVGFIDQVFASDGEQNRKGQAKAGLLSRMFPAGFIYARESRADLHCGRTPPASSSSTAANQCVTPRAR